MARRGENIYERNDGRFEGRYIKGYDINGKAIIGYIYGRSYKEAKEKLAFAKAQVEHERSKPPSEMYISEWFEKWLSTQKHIKKSSYSVYSSLIRQLLVIGINQKIAIQWDFPITYEMARAYQKANGKYLRQNQWEDITLVMSLELGR